MFKEKMMAAKKWVLLLVVLGFLGSVSYAQEKIIRLKDGTVMRAKVLSKENDIYRFQSPTLGEVAVKEADVAAIEDPVVQTGPATQVDAYRQKILQDPSTMASVQELAQDKEVLEMFSDPALRDAIMRQDMEFLKNNEKFIKFSQNPAVQKIANQVKPPVQATNTTAQ